MFVIHAVRSRSDKLRVKNIPSVMLNEYQQKAISFEAIEIKGQAGHYHKLNNFSNRKF